MAARASDRRAAASGARLRPRAVQGVPRPDPRRACAGRLRRSARPRTQRRGCARVPDARHVGRRRRRALRGAGASSGQSSSAAASARSSPSGSPLDIPTASPRWCSARRWRGSCLRARWPSTTGSAGPRRVTPRGLLRGLRRSRFRRVPAPLPAAVDDVASDGRADRRADWDPDALAHWNAPRAARSTSAAIWPGSARRRSWSADEDDPRGRRSRGVDEVVAALPSALVRSFSAPGARHSVFRDSPEAPMGLGRFLAELEREEAARDEGRREGSGSSSTSTAPSSCRKARGCESGRPSCCSTRPGLRPLGLQGTSRAEARRLRAGCLRRPARPRPQRPVPPEEARLTVGRRRAVRSATPSDCATGRARSRLRRARRSPPRPASRASSALIVSAPYARVVATRIVEAFDRLGGPEAGEAARSFYAEPGHATLGEYLRRCYPLIVRSQEAAEDADGSVFSADTFIEWTIAEGQRLRPARRARAHRGPDTRAHREDDPYTPLSSAREVAERPARRARALPQLPGRAPPRLPRLRPGALDEARAFVEELRASQARPSRPSSRSRTAGHSSSSTLYQALSRFSPPRTSMCLRWMPSKVAPSASSAPRERSFSASVLSSTRRQPHRFEGLFEHEQLRLDVRAGAPGRPARATSSRSRR